MENIQGQFRKPYGYIQGLLYIDRIIMAKKTTILLIIGLSILVLGGTGGYIGLYYKAVSQIEVDVESVSITGMETGGTILNPTMDVDLEINAMVSNPTIILVDIDNVEFDIYFEGDYYGNGDTGPFKAMQNPTEMTINAYLVDIGGLMYVELADLIIAGNSKTLTIDLTAAHAFGLTIDLDEQIEVVIAQEDIKI